MRLVVLGDGGVGKTALLVRLTTGKFGDGYEPTIEDAFQYRAVVGDKPEEIDVLDTAGQEEYSALRDQWIRGADGYIVVYNICNRGSYRAVDELVENIADVEPERMGRTTIVGNQSDRAAERRVTTEEAAAKARSLGCQFFEASAKTGERVEDMFNAAARALAHEREPQPLRRKRRCVIM